MRSRRMAMERAGIQLAWLHQGPGQGRLGMCHFYELWRLGPMDSLPVPREDLGPGTADELLGGLMFQETTFLSSDLGALARSEPGTLRHLYDATATHVSRGEGMAFDGPAYASIGGHAARTRSPRAAASRHLGYPSELSCAASG